MRNFLISVSTERCLSNGEVFTIASFLDKNSGDGYGLKHFITEDGEVAFINMIVEKNIPDEWDDIDKYFWDEKNSRTKYVDVNINDAWRYFADPSRDGKLWYMEAMHYHAKCTEKITLERLQNSELIEEKEIFVTPQSITYNKWNNLSEEEKKWHMNYLFEHPVSGFYPIIDDEFHKGLFG